MPSQQRQVGSGAGGGASWPSLQQLAACNAAGPAGCGAPIGLATAESSWLWSRFPAAGVPRDEAAAHGFWELFGGEGLGPASFQASTPRHLPALLLLVLLLFAHTA